MKKKKSNPVLNSLRKEGFALREHLPEDPYMAALAGLTALGGAGLLYKWMAPSIPKPEEVLPARQVRIALARKALNDMEDSSLDKMSQWQPTWAQRAALGAAVPFGLYGLYRAYEQATERLGRERLERKLSHLEKLTDPTQVVGKKREALRQKTASADEALADVVLENLARGEMQKVAQGGTWEMLKRWAPYLLGAAAGTGGLGAYLLTKRQILPPSHMQDLPDVRERQLAYDVEEALRSRRRGRHGLA